MATRKFTVRARIEAEDRASATIGRVESRFKRFTTSLRANALKITAALAAVVLAFKAFQASLNLSSQQAVLSRQLEAAGTSFDSFISKAKEAAAQTVSTADIIRSATAGKLLGVGFEEQIELFEIARVSAAAFGVTTSKAFDDLAIGIGRQSRQILDNLGIIVTAEVAYQTFADEIGKAASELTDMERRQAFLNAVMREGRDRVEAFGDVVGGLGESLQRAGAQLSDVQRAAGLLAQACAEGAISAAEFATETGNLADSLLEATREFRAAGTATTAYFAAVLEGKASLLATLDAVLAYNRALEETTDDTGDAAAKARELAKQKKDERDAVIEAKKAHEGLVAQLDAEVDAYARAIESASKFGEVTSVQLEVKLIEINQALLAQQEILGATSPEYQRLARIVKAESESMLARIQSLKRGFGDLGDETDDASQAFEDLVGSMQDAETSSDSLGRTIVQTTRALADQATQAIRTAAQFDALVASSGRAAAIQAALAGGATLSSAGRRLNFPGGSRLTSDPRTGQSPLFPGLGGGVFTTVRQARVSPDGRIIFD